MVAAGLASGAGAAVFGSGAVALGSGTAAVVSPHRAISSGARVQVKVREKKRDPALPTTLSLSSLSRFKATSYLLLRSGL